MQIPIRLSAGLARSAGAPRHLVTLAEGATVADAAAALAHRLPALESMLTLAVTVVGGRQVTGSEPLSDGQELAFLLPVAGGAPARHCPIERN